MYTKHHYSWLKTLNWSRRQLIIPSVWAAFVTALYDFAGLTWLSLPWLPISAVAVAVAFYLGFKNNASYDRMWEARKIWGAIVNASRSWTFGVRDLIGAHGNKDDTACALEARQLVVRHVAWMDALRFQLRQLETWEHREGLAELRHQLGVPEYCEDLPSILREHLGEEESSGVLARINPAAHLLAAQSQQLRRLRREDRLDGFSHIHLQALLDELMAQQGKAERIKKFPFPRQYATVNYMFAIIFALLVPLGLLKEFAALGAHMVWVTVPFSTLVAWVFLTADKIGEWSENPFEGLHNDVPISAMARGIERDIREMVGETALPPVRPLIDDVMF